MTAEGQLLVCFSDGTSCACLQQHAWIRFVHDGVIFEWCCASWDAADREPLVVVAVRSARESTRVIGATLPQDTTVTEADAKSVVDAHGGADRFRATAAVVEASKRRLRHVDRPPFPASFGLIGDRRVGHDVSAHRFPTVNLDEHEISPDVVRLLPGERCAHHGVMPVTRAGTALIVAMVDPTNADAIDDLKFQSGYSIEPVISTEAEIRRAIVRYYKIER